MSLLRWRAESRGAAFWKHHATQGVSGHSPSLLLQGRLQLAVHLQVGLLAQALQRLLRETKAALARSQVTEQGLTGCQTASGIRKWAQSGA